MGSTGSQTNADSWEVAISANAAYIAYSSDASNIVQSDTNGTRDVFVYARATGNTIRASVEDKTLNGNANAASDQPFLNEDGSMVVFRSVASDLTDPAIDPDTNTVPDIFLHNRDSDNDGIFDESNAIRTIRVSTPDIGAPDTQSNGESATPTISNDGQWIAFASRATNLQILAPDDGDPNVWDVYLRDWINGTTVLVSLAVDLGDTGDSYTPFISGNSRFVAFASRAYSLNQTNLVPPEVAGDFDADIFVFDRTPPPATSPISYISVNFFGDQAQNGDSFSPSITADGRLISFASEANNLDVNLADFNARRDIYVHDRTLALSGVYDFGLTQRVSLNFSGGEPNEWSFVPVIAQDSSQLHVAYVSEATNLVTNDTNSVWDVFAFNGQRTIPTFLSIPANIPGSIGDFVFVPVNFDPDDQAIDTTTFSVDFDETCLSFDPAAPNAVTFSLPADFIRVWSYSASDLNGEIDFSIYDQVAPRASLPEGTMLQIRLQVKSACAAAPGSTYNARVGFSNDPAPSFGSFGQSIFGYSSDGFVRILPGALGDCNGDGLVDAGDLSALVLEIFDGDDVLPENTPGGSFPGNPVGCNPNQDMVVDAGDLSCTVLIIWGGGSAACAGGTSQSLSSISAGLAASSDVTLAVPVMQPAVAGEKVALPLRLDPQGAHISSMVFSVDYDQSWLAYDTAVFNLPQGYLASIKHEPADEDGELDIVIYYPGLDAPILAVQDIVTITFNAGKPQGDFVAVVKSSPDPSASFGSTSGTSLPGVMTDGSVLIAYMDNFIYLPVTVSQP
jgi:Tol biopolymer transport system component